MKMDSHAAFLTTQWSLIDAIQTGRSESAVAMNRLAEIYLPAVYSFLRRNGHTPESAEELAQDFFDKVVLGRLLFHNADSTKGSLRSLILKALKNFVIDTVRAQNARGARRTVSLDAMERADSMLGADADPAEAFNRQIAGAQFELAIDRCREHFAASGLINHWRLYEVRVLHPATRGTKATALKDCFGEFGFSQARDAAAAVQTVKRALIALFRVVVAESMPPNTPPGEVEAEFQSALAALRLGGETQG